MASSGSLPAPDPTAPLVGQSPAMHALRTQLRHPAAIGAVYDWFTDGFDTADLQEASALLGNCKTGVVP